MVVGQVVQEEVDGIVEELLDELAEEEVSKRIESQYPGITEVMMKASKVAPKNLID